MPESAYEQRVAAHLALAAMRFDDIGEVDKEDITRTLGPYQEGRRDPFKLIRALAYLPMFVEVERADTDPPDADTLAERLRGLEATLMERKWRFPDAFDETSMWGRE